MSNDERARGSSQRVTLQDSATARAPKARRGRVLPWFLIDGQIPVVLTARYLDEKWVDDRGPFEEQLLIYRTGAGNVAIQTAPATHGIADVLSGEMVRRLSANSVVPVLVGSSNQTSPSQPSRQFALFGAQSSAALMSQIVDAAHHESEFDRQLNSLGSQTTAP